MQTDLFTMHTCERILMFKTGNLKIISLYFSYLFHVPFLAVLATYLELALLSHMDELSLRFFWENNTIEQSLQHTQVLLARNM